jgi:hypothetical protein
MERSAWYEESRFVILLVMTSFRREGTLRNQEIAADGTLRNMVIFAMIPDDR